MGPRKARSSAEEPIPGKAEAAIATSRNMPKATLEKRKRDQDSEPSDDFVSAKHCSGPLQKLWKKICNNKKSFAGTAAVGLAGAGAYLYNRSQKQSSKASKYLKAAGAIVGLGALGATAYYRNKKAPTDSSEDSSSISPSSEAPRANRQAKLTKRSKPSKKNEKSSNTLLICSVVTFFFLVVAYYTM